MKLTTIFSILFGGRIQLATLLPALVLTAISLQAGTVTWTVHTTNQPPEIHFGGTIDTGAGLAPQGAGWYGMSGHFTFYANCDSGTGSLCSPNIPYNSQFHSFSYRGFGSYGTPLNFGCNPTYTYCTNHYSGDGGVIDINFESSLFDNSGPIGFYGVASMYNSGRYLPHASVSGYVTPDVVSGSTVPEPATSLMAAAALLALGGHQSRRWRKSGLSSRS